MIRRAAAFIFCLGTLAAQPAAADISEVLACQAIRNADERLACFDRTVPSLRQAPPPSTSITPAPAAPAATSEQRFGAERLPTEQQPGRPADANSITAGVKSIRQLVPGRYIVVLDNEQVWYVKEGATLRIKPGERVTIERGALDSYLMRKEGAQQSYRVERIN